MGNPQIVTIGMVAVSEAQRQNTSNPGREWVWKQNGSRPVNNNIQ
jgi:hypothetical protein